MNDIIETPVSNHPEVHESPSEDNVWPEVISDQLPPELAQAQANQQQAEQSVLPKQEEKKETVKQDKTPQESFRSLKAKADRFERERDELARKNEELQSRQSKEPDEDLSVFLGNDEIAEGKHLSQFQKQIDKLKKEILETKKQTNDATMEAKLKSQYPDIDSVVSTENIELLKEMDPESALIVDSLPNFYTKAIAAYKAIKTMNLNKQRENMYDAEKEKAQRNSAKPRPAISVSPQAGDNPLSSANPFAQGLTKDIQKQLLKEMFEARMNH